ncbi:MAG: nitroreductase family protein [Thermoplasmata archaeon]|nr:nitroreductase family protein [Thermoplasmata archaeon]
MEVAEAIRRRRAFRALDSQPIDRGSVSALIDAVMLSASCFNNQPWNLVFCSSEESLRGIRTALPKGNAWATKSPLIIVAASKEEEDCQLSDRRNYHLFDCGLAIGQMLLRATELGFVAHPIAGYDPSKVREVLGIPDDRIIITLVICGFHGQDDTLLSDKQREAERERPRRKAIGENFHSNKWGAPFG